MQGFLDDFRQTVETASDRLLKISEEQSQQPRASDKWSPKEIVGHLIDSAANNHSRFVRAQLSDELVFPGYEQEDWVRVQAYKEEPWSQLVLLWKHYNLHIVHLMSKASEDARSKLRSKHNLDQIASQSIAASEPATLEYFMRDYVYHLKSHLDQIL